MTALFPFLRHVAGPLIRKVKRKCSYFAKKNFEQWFDKRKNFWKEIRCKILNMELSNLISDPWCTLVRFSLQKQHNLTYALTMGIIHLKKNWHFNIENKKNTYLCNYFYSSWCLWVDQIKYFITIIIELWYSRIVY